MSERYPDLLDLIIAFALLLLAISTLLLVGFGIAASLGWCA